METPYDPVEDTLKDAKRLLEEALEQGFSDSSLRTCRPLVEEIFDLAHQLLRDID